MEGKPAELHCQVARAAGTDIAAVGLVVVATYFYVRTCIDPWCVHVLPLGLGLGCVRG